MGTDVSHAGPLGSINLSEAELHAVRAKLRLLLQALQVPTVTLDLLLTGLSSLLRRLVALRVQQLDIGLAGSTLWLQARNLPEPVALGGLLHPVRIPGGWRFEAPLAGIGQPDWSALREIVARRGRAQLIDDLQAHQASLEREIERRTRALSVSELRSRTVIDGAPLAVVLIDQAGVVSEWNAVAEQTFGHSAARAVGRPLQALIELSGEPTLPSILARGLDAEARQLTAARFWDLSALREDGSRIPVEAGMTVFPIGETWHGTLFARDSSERKQAEAAMQTARQAAESAAQMKSDFLANMSHEIRTPMNAILGMSHLVLKAELAPRQREYVSKIQQSGQHLLAIINDILDFSKVEADKLVVESVDFELEHLLDNVATLVADKAAAKGLELVFDVGRDVPTSLVGDPLRLGQVLVNYASNAIKFTEKGGIDVVVRVRQRSAGQVLLHFAVRDTGIGLAEDQQERLFQSFQQADTSTTRKYGGTGLGLAICKKLAVLMGGEVGVNSQLGQGSTFWFTARLSLSTSKPRAVPLSAKLRGLRVLVVDDNDSARTVLRTLLEAMMFEVDDAASGAAALAMLRQAMDTGRPYEMVYLDWQMPEMDGFETAQRIRALQLPATMRTVMVTAFGREELLARAESCGIADVLMKPVNASGLLDCTMRVLADGTEPPPPGALQPAHAPYTDRLDELQGAYVLLVEDNELNQEVAVGLLEDAGVRADIAENGAIALEMVQRQAYDLVLMDMQMPVMDGVTATLAIRQLPDFAAPPIVAMTANAMQVDRDRCAAAGMVDFVSKPIEPADLVRTLLRWLPPQAERAARPAPPPRAPAAPAPPPAAPLQVEGLNTAAGLRRTLGKTDLYLSLLRKFEQGQQDVPAQIRTALDAGDMALAQRLAHTMKGVAGNIGAEPLQAAAATLEHAIRAQHPRTELAALLAAMELPLRALLQALAPVLRPPATAATTEAPVDTQQFQRIGGELRALLASDDAAALELLEQHRGLLQQVLGADFEALARAAADFDFSQALELLDGALAA
ncbi:hybrid sensor histidine kinase/response regulator [Pseudorhodoferax sp.]|uniref:hybrid sensor histidine kinase/response regulator n=1 Tax=Pseudorhodoferax sp. TaxID=1993553 RepID=UPI002DD63158|nr:response regulator [Pseudorhodoferax sp.]